MMEENSISHTSKTFAGGAAEQDTTNLIVLIILYRMQEVRRK